jgi:PAS domain S-box-containing protein
MPQLEVSIMDDNGKTRDQPIQGVEKFHLMIDELKKSETERKRTEGVVQKNLRFLQQLMDAIPTPIFYKDTEGIYRGGNKELEGLWGLPLDQIIGKTVYEISPPDLAEIYERADKELFNNPGVQRYETSLSSSNGIRHNVIFNKATFTNGEGKVAGLIGVINDITELKQAEEARRKAYDELEQRVAERTAELRQANKELKESEEKYRFIFENAVEGIYQTSEGRIITANPAIARIFGYESPEEFITTISDVRTQIYASPDQRDKVIELMNKNGFVKNFELQCRHKNGKIIWLTFNTRPVRDNQGTVLYYAGTCQDITERKRTEEALKKSEKNLRVLSNRLINAQENERKRIAFELHDELGQSLVGLKFQLSILQKKSTGMPEDLTLEFSQALKNIDEMTENIRRLSRELRPSVIEHMGLLEALHWLFEDFSVKYGIKVLDSIKEIKKNFSKEQEIIIFRIFQEALLNIGKHAQATQVTMSVAEEKKLTVFLIQDNGKGFNTKTVNGKDLLRKGLGLIAMQERALMAGGTIEIKSQPGKCTLITFAIPGRRTRKNDNTK